MVRLFVLYEVEPAPERYEAHAEICRKVQGATLRHGKIARKLHGDADYAYYAEFEFADMDAFKAASVTDEFKEAGKDAAEMGLPHSVYLAEVE